jgi:putative FmdB family regulatory protein
MPFYEYQCSACGHHHEELEKVSDRPLRKCPACGRARLRRLVSAPVFRLKGAGWYETDFKNDKEAKRNIAGEKEPAAGESPPAEKPKDDKAESKPVEPKAAETKGGAAAAAKPGADSKKPKAAQPKPARRRRGRR